MRPVPIVPILLFHVFLYGLHDVKVARCYLILDLGLLINLKVLLYVSI